MRSTEEISLRLNEFLQGKELNSKKDYEKAVQEFMTLYNSCQLNDGYEESPFAKSRALLEKAENAKNINEAKKILKEAITLDPKNLDAKVSLLNLEQKTPWNCLDKLEVLLQEEEKWLEEEAYFKQDMGHFYGIVETRPYMRTLATKLHLLKELGRVVEAISVAERIVALNENDNLGARYILMGLYAWMGDYEKGKALYKKYPEESLSMLIPFSLLCFRAGDYKKCKSVWAKICRANSDALDILMNYYDEFYEDVDMYSPNGDEEVELACHNLTELLDATPCFFSFLIEQFPER